MPNTDDRIFYKLLLVLCNVVGLVILPVVGLYYYQIPGLIAGGLLGGLLYLACSKR